MILCVLAQLSNLALTEKVPQNRTNTCQFAGALVYVAFVKAFARLREGQTTRAPIGPEYLVRYLAKISVDLHSC